MAAQRLKYRVPDGLGLIRVVDPVAAGMKLVHMDFLRLSNGQSAVLGEAGRELGAVVLGGSCHVTADKGGIDDFIEGRKDVFSGLPHAVYIPAGAKADIQAQGALEMVIFGTPAPAQGEVRIVRPGDIRILTIGEGNWAIQGYFILGSDFPAHTLIVGETQIPPGNWCSVPPHSHEKDVPGKETSLEEIYYFRFNPSCGFGMQGLYTDDRALDDGFLIRDNDVILVPRGYHPNVAGPGYEMRMLWGMGGTTRQWIPYEDPDHAWLGKNAKAPSDVSWK